MNNGFQFISDWEAVVKLSDDFNGADLRNVCTEAGKNLAHGPEVI